MVPAGLPGIIGAQNQFLIMQQLAPENAFVDSQVGIFDYLGLKAGQTGKFGRHRGSFIG